MEVTGFVTILFNRLVKTSDSAPGAFAIAASCKSRVMGNRKLPITAPMAAINVLNMYSEITVRKRGPSPFPAFEMLEATNTITNKGAIAFSALTNILPRMPIAVHPGTISPSTTPMLKPIRMRNTKLSLRPLTQKFFYYLHTAYKDTYFILDILPQKQKKDFELPIRVMLEVKSVLMRSLCYNVSSLPQTLSRSGHHSQRTYGGR